MSQTQTESSVNSFICVDIGSALVRIAEAVKTELGVSIRAVAAEKVIDKKKMTPQETAEIIKNLMASAGISSAAAVFALSGNALILRHVDFPKMPLDALEKNVKNEMKKELGAAADNLNYRQMVLKEFDAKNEDGSVQKKMKVLVCAFDPQTINDIKDIAGAAGLTIHSITSANLGMYSMAKKMGALDTLLADEVLMFLDFGNSQMTTNFISRDGLRFSKDINMGGSTLTTVIKTLNPGGSAITMAEAEDMKFKIGILSQDAVDGMDDSNPNANLHKVLNVSFRKLLQRIRLSTGYFFAHFKESVSFQALKAIYLAGGNSSLKGVKEFFTEYYGSAIIKVNCWDFCESQGCDPDLKEVYNLSFANICAAMHEFFYPEYFINFNDAPKAAAAGKTAFSFSTEEFIDKNIPVLKYLTKYGTLNTITLIMTVYMVLFSFAYGWNYWTIYSIEKEKKEKISMVKELDSTSAKEAREKIEKEHAAYMKKKNSREILEFKKYPFDQIMLALSECMLPDVSLKFLNFANEEKPVFTMSGVTTVYASALNFSEALRKKKIMAGVNLKKIEQINNLVEFQLEMLIGAEAMK